MSKASRDKGARYERKLAAFLTNSTLGLWGPFERRLEQWRKGGDDFVQPFEKFLSLEAKDVAAVSLGAWIDQSVASAGTRIAFVIHHRRGNGDPARDFATTTVSDLVEICHVLARYENEYGPIDPVNRPDTDPKEATQ